MSNPNNPVVDLAHARRKKLIKNRIEAGLAGKKIAFVIWDNDPRHDPAAARQNPFDAILGEKEKCLVLQSSAPARRG